MAKSSRGYSPLRKKKTQRNKKHKHKKRRLTRKYKNMKGGVKKYTYQIKKDDKIHNLNYKYFQFIPDLPKKSILTSQKTHEKAIEKAKQTELNILINKYTNNPNEYKSFQILVKEINKKGIEVLEEKMFTPLKYEFNCGINKFNSYTVSSGENKGNTNQISNGTFPSYMKEQYVWRFRVNDKNKSLILLKREVEGPSHGKAQVEEQSNTITEYFYREPIIVDGKNLDEAYLNSNPRNPELLEPIKKELLKQVWESKYTIPDDLINYVENQTISPTYKTA